MLVFLICSIYRSGYLISKRHQVFRHLLPTIEGKIHALYHGYEISLDIKIHDVTLVLLLTWFGGLFITICSILDNLVVGTKNPQYLEGDSVAVTSTPEEIEEIMMRKELV